jgi:hypothetical protein
MNDQVVGLLLGNTLSLAVCRELLEQLVDRCPERADPIAASWAENPVVGDESDQLRQAGCSVLIIRNPATALTLIEADFEIRGIPALREMAVLWAWRGHTDVRWDLWPVAQLERIGRLLIRGYPATADDPQKPPMAWGDPGHEDQLCQIRNRVIDVLLHHSDPDAQAGLDRLVALDPKIGEYVENHRTSALAGNLIPTLDMSGARDPSAFTLDEAVRILERGEYRLIRSADDLLEAVIECLRTINGDIGYDVAMLYGRPDRSRKGKARKHLEEDALQTYIRRRLLDLLPRLADGVAIHISREEHGQRRQRLDLRIMAPCHGHQATATVVTEIKWSTNSETKTGLTDQLGTRYLLADKLTRGIFLVGWSGEWRPGDGTGQNTDIDHLRSFLAAQANSFHVAHPTVVIEPFVLDARWVVPH